MKIDNTGLDPTRNSRSNSTEKIENQAKSGRKDEYKNDINGKDEAAVSELARLLAKTHQSLQETPEIREGLVEELRQKIQDGSYDIPTQELVKKLLDRFQ